MQRLSLVLVCALLAPSCGDDLPQDSVTSTGTTSDDTGSTTNPGTSSDGSGTTTDPDPTTTTATTTGLDSSSSGPGIECGNGELEGDEECDDGNTDNGDSCYSNCTLPYETLWTLSVHGGEGGDSASHAIFDGDGNLYVLGSSTVAGQGRDLWLQQYMADGSEGWAYTYNNDMSNLDDFGAHMAWHPSGDLLITGSTETAEGDDILVMRLGIADQMPVWMEIYDGVGTDMGNDNDNNDFGDGIIGAANGDVLVAGIERTDGFEWDTWLRRYDADGNVLWTQTYDNPMFGGSDIAVSVVEDSGGDLYLVGRTEVSPGDFEMWVRKYDAMGTEIWTQQLDGYSPGEARIDANDNLVIGGLGTANFELWIARYDPDFVEVDSVTYSGIMGNGALGNGLALDAAGDVYAAGFLTVVGQQSNTWVGRYSADLSQRWWANSYGNEEAKLGDQLNSVAVSDDGTHVAAVGFETVLGESSNIWIRMYQNNPTP